MNPLDPRVETGVSGELLVILRLLEYHIQACFTLEDSGNDLIAIKDNIMKTIQVKSSIRGKWKTPELNKKYDILALVFLVGGDESRLSLDDSKIYLLSKNEVDGKRNLSEKQVSSFALNKNTIKKLFYS